MLVTDSERKLVKLSDRVVKECKKGLTINCKKKKMAKESAQVTCEILGIVTIKQVQKFILLVLEQTTIDMMHTSKGLYE